MKGDLTAESKTGHDHLTARDGSSASAWRSSRLRGALAVALAMLAGAALAALVAQVPARHAVDVGGLDAAYAQGFFDPERADQPGERPYLVGSDGAARWSGESAFLLFPQAALPGELTIRLRGRAEGSEVLVLLGGGGELAHVAAGPEWQELRVPVTGGLLKLSDVLIELRSDTGRLSEADPRSVGVLLDRAEYRTAGFPATPYPAQIVLGALSGGLMALLLRGARLAAGLGALALASLLLYHLQPLYPHPLRWLPAAMTLGLAALVALRHAPLAAARAAWLPDGLALGGIGAWLAVVLAAGREHLALSVPGVEKDFRVFATRAFDPAEVFRADGFYNLGYPLLLWITTPLAQGNPFLAARGVAAVSGAVLLLATWWLARGLAGRWAGLLAVTALGLSALTAQYGLYIGSDMPFAALCALALALLVSSTTDHRPTTTDAGAQGQVSSPGPFVLRPSSFVVLAGFVGGAAFLVRHPGLLLLPLGWLAILGLRRGAWRANLRPAALFTLAFALAALPQVLVNLRDTGQPLYSQQAKNVWLAVYGDGDWGRWAETSDDVTLGRVVLQDPGRFLGAWWANVRAFLGTGAEDTSEFGRATQLRLLGFPANWLALAGLALWIARLRSSPRPALLIGFVALYVATVSVGLSLTRFFLPLAPIYAAAAACAGVWAAERLAPRVGEARAQAGVALVALALLWGGLGAGLGYVLRPQPDPSLPGQPRETLAAAQLIQQTLGPGERVAARLAPSDEEGLALTKYSAVAHLFAADGASYILWSRDVGEQPEGAVAGAAGRYLLIRLTQ